MSAYEKFEERENSGGLFPDYMMRNGHPEPVNNEAGPSVQAKPAWQCHNDMAAQQGEFNRVCSIADLGYKFLKIQVISEFGEQHQFWQQNGFNDAGSSKQEVPLFSQHTTHQGQL
jgi:hypothetical protein